MLFISTRWISAGLLLNEPRSGSPIKFDLNGIRLLGKYNSFTFWSSHYLLKLASQFQSCSG